MSTALTLSGFWCRGRSGFTLGPVDVALGAGEVLVVLGPAGSGKSLLIAGLAGLAPVAGQLTLAADGARPSVAMVFQNAALDDGASALENVARAATAARVAAPFDAARAALASVGLAAAMHKHPRALSGGMRRRAAIARALVVRPTLLLLDDPTAGLDPRTAAEVLELAWRAAPLTVVATHDVDGLAPRADRVLVLGPQSPHRSAPLFTGTAAQLAVSAPNYAPIEATWPW